MSAALSEFCAPLRFGGLDTHSWLHSAQAMLAGGIASLGLLKSVEQAAASVAFAALAPPSAFAVTVQAPSGALWECAPGVQSCPGDADASPDDRSVREDKDGPDGHRFINRKGSSPEQSVGGSSRVGLGTQLSLSGRYIEDCRLSQPSSEARSPEAAAALWSVTQELLVTRLLCTAADNSAWAKSRSESGGG